MLEGFDVVYQSWFSSFVEGRWNFTRLDSRAANFLAVWPRYNTPPNNTQPTKSILMSFWSCINYVLYSSVFFSKVYVTIFRQVQLKNARQNLRAVSVDKYKQEICGQIPRFFQEADATILSLYPVATMDIRIGWRISRLIQFCAAKN